MPSRAVIDTPLGHIALTWDDDGLTALDYVSDAPVSTPSPSSGLAAETIRQLRQYFQDPAFGFHLPLSPQGTPFQQRVWAALCRIPPGAPITYGQLARHLNTGPRAIGGACRRNPLPIIIPCHRVVPAHGGLGGYGGATRGAGPRIKQWLLVHEKTL
ncbi:cysteine methyltransferase [Ectothiorhodospira haloalkaliphila]|uniref:methylated-DNA--[protein]-cysteine S-methyltransferase n=1 Tax=Ectothiorhodospira haloalkaliphila TaxID=421628 RepID=W8L329_9GAMM|nr:methylated-DNA--[protein]-cysteine S-methyltransferase [Ectothiorhodospira haloalkaliphila]AHK78355.1 cysteine methyltransferase [Ectothiorhodospira haloalkaliphila]